MRKIMIFGTFDHLHAGHRFLVKQAQARGSVSVVVGTDPNVVVIKGRPPRQKIEERIKALVTAFPDIKVAAGSSDDFLAPIQTHKPDLLLFGYDQKLPPGISFNDLQCPYERAEAFQPEIYKSSLLSKKS